MDTPNKVIVTITPAGYCTEVFAGEKCISKRESKMISAGEARATDKGDFYDDLPEFEDLAEAMEDGLSFGPFGIASELLNIHEADEEQDAPLCGCTKAPGCSECFEVWE